MCYNEEVEKSLELKILHSLNMYILFMKYLGYVFYLSSYFPILVFWDKVSICSPCYPGTHYAGLELRDPPMSASQVLFLMNQG